MVRKIGLLCLWVALVSYAFLLAPDAQPDTIQTIVHLSSGKWAGINPLIIALFNLMGIWPLIYGCVLLVDGRGQKLPAWPFALASFALGAFALLPYLAWRQPNSQFTGEKNLWISLADSRLTGAVAFLGALVLLIYGAIDLDWGDFVVQWQTSRFIHVMSWDFCLLWLLFPLLLGDDMARRGLKDARIFWAVALIPILGAAGYLAFRPPLPGDESMQLEAPASGQ